MTLEAYKRVCPVTDVKFNEQVTYCVFKYVCTYICISLYSLDNRCAYSLYVCTTKALGIDDS